jgi:hypothetical protein
MRTSSLRNLAIALSAVALVFAATSSVRGALTPIGDPQEGGSWGQRFNESGVGPFTHMEAIMGSAGDGFEFAGFANFNAGGWSGAGSSTHIVASGPSQTSLDFDIFFAGARTDPLWFNFYAYNGTDPMEAVRAEWNGGGWSFTLLDKGSAPTPVPEPTTMIAGALLLLPFGVSTLRILRKKRAA